jgi:hypothetical protein
VSPVLLLLSLGATPVAAETQARPIHRFELGVVGGAFVPAVAGPSAVTPFRSVGLDFALRFGVRALETLAFEIEMGHVALRAEDKSELSAYSFGGQAVLEYPSFVAPFVLAGGGAMGLPSNADDALGSPTPSLHWGAGIKHRLADEVSTRAEGRHVIGFDGRHHAEALLSVAFLFGADDGDDQ